MVIRKTFARDENEASTPEEKRENDWRLFMQELGIHGCGVFEKQLVEFLESGFFEAAGIEGVIDRYVVEREAITVREAAQNFIKKAIWDHRVDEEQLVAEAATLQASAALLDPFVATELQLVLERFPGGAPIGDEIIDKWITAYRDSNPLTVNEDNPFGNRLHPKIQAEFDVIKTTTLANASIVDACMHVIANCSWGTMQEVIFKRATAVDFETTIREIEDLDMLRRFMRQMIKMLEERSSYDPHFGTATEHFLEACRAIASDKASPRLAGLVRRLLARHLTPELGLESHANGHTATPIP